jgi:DNA (cytosine-5)-methyltransferase 1
VPVSTVRPRAKAKVKAQRVACHRPAQKTRMFRHDELIAVDLFSGFGGLTQGIRMAGYTTIMAANHNAYKIAVHEANHPDAEHWIADLVDPESSDYHSAADLPRADLLVAGISCTHHSGANTKKAYERGWTLFDMPQDEEYETRVTNSERDRATALCVLQYAAKNNPRVMIIECTTELTAWGPLIPGTKIGDGSSYRWWRKEIAKLRYNSRVLYLNSMFFGVSQSRDRYYLVCWKDDMQTPDLEHRPLSHCGNCNDVVEAVWSWKTGVPPSGVVRYGQQYNYTCPRCRREVIPPMAPSINALDLTDLGKRIGDRETPLADSTMSRAERCVRLFPKFPAVQVPMGMLPQNHPWLTVGDGGGAVARTQPATNTVGMVTPPVALHGQIMDAHVSNGDGRHLSQPMNTITTTHARAMLIGGVTNYQGAPRALAEPLPTPGGSETMAIVSAGLIPFRKNTVPTTHAEPAPTFTSEQRPGLITAAGFVKQNGGVDQAQYRAHPVSSPFGTIVASGGQALVTSGWSEQLGAIWREAVSRIRVEDCFFRMLKPHEVGRACGFNPDFPGQKGDFEVWGSAKDQIDGYGNAVSPFVGMFIGLRLRPILTSC